jgi:N-acetylglucosaminyldiphosphoundecaprenol N-acetyl-beta-D-mannosaminyltransferase
MTTATRLTPPEAEIDEVVCPRLVRTPVLSVPVDALRREDFPTAVEELIRRPGMRVIAPVNVDILNQTTQNPALRSFLQRADAVYADGSGVVLGARLLGGHLPGRLTAADLILDLSARWQHGRLSMYFLGGAPGVAEKAAQVLRARFPGVAIAGTWRGHLRTENEEREALSDIRARRPDLLCVGFGTPIQEDFVERYRRELADVPLVWPVGAMTTYIAGVVPRAPEWMRDNGLEWLYRFTLEPRRLWQRYAVGNPLFVARVLAERANSMIRKAKGASE